MDTKTKQEIKINNKRPIRQKVPKQNKYGYIQTNPRWFQKILVQSNQANLNFKCRRQACFSLPLL